MGRILNELDAGEKIAIFRADDASALRCRRPRKAQSSCALERLASHQSR